MKKCELIIFVSIYLKIVKNRGEPIIMNAVYELIKINISITGTANYDILLGLIIFIVISIWVYKIVGEKYYENIYGKVFSIVIYIFLNVILTMFIMFLISTVLGYANIFKGT